MHIDDIKRGDVLVSVDQRGAAYYRVRRVHTKKITVVGENGNEFRAYPATFDRRITYPVPTLPEE